ncbi:MAG: glycosyltransferase, partial [Bacteroidota bacterium]|nr:glycosyltransferase [Bacteroidota bacterium]
MKVVIINTYDVAGGAAIAALRLAKALEKQNIDITMLVQKKKTDEQIVQQTNNNFFNRKKKLFYFAFERLLFKFKERDPSVRFDFSIANIGEDISKHKLVQDADIIHFHWINFGFLSLKSLSKIFALKKTIIWTLHDMWPFTGGCHHAYECNNYVQQCGNCPFLKKPFENDLSFKIWAKKNALFSNQKLNIVSVSSWLSQRAKNSSLFKNKSHYVIANALNSVFEPVDKIIARKKLGADSNKIILLFGSVKIDNPIKGFKYFVEALNILKQNSKIDNDNVLIYILGTVKNNKEALLEQLPFEYKYFGFVKDEKKLINIYSASTLTIATSLYETFG